MLKAEHEHTINMSSTPSLSSNQINNNETSQHYLSATGRLHNGISQSSPQHPTTDLSPNQLQHSDTQSSESSREPLPVKPRSQKRTHYHHQRGRSHDKLPASTSQPARHSTVCKDDLVNAYSPVVDRQRHSSSASSNGPVKIASSSPIRQSQERPFGYHHVGACMSPSKRTQQWAILSPFNRTPEYKQKETAKQITSTSAKKSLDFSPQQSKSGSTLSSSSKSAPKNQE